jgi:hypothetical protein
MSSGGRASGKQWKHAFAVSVETAIDAPATAVSAQTLVNQWFGPLYPNTVFFDSITLSEPAKKVNGEGGGAYNVIPLISQGQRDPGGAGNDRTALECCLTMNMFVGAGKPSLLWLRGALLEAEVSFASNGGWNHVTNQINRHDQVIAALDPTNWAMKPGRINMKTRDVASFRPATKFQMGGIRARQVRVNKKKPVTKSENGALKQLIEIAPTLAGVLAFILTKGKAGISPAARVGIVSTAGSLVQMAGQAIETLIAPDPVQ